MLIENGVRASAPADAFGRRFFAPLEWLVIAMGAPACSRPLASSILGRQLLAMEPEDASCLETLRRTAQLATRCGWGIPSAEVGAFLMAGWSEEQLGALIESVLQGEFGGAEAPTAEPSRGEFGRRSFEVRASTMEMHV